MQLKAFDSFHKGYSHVKADKECEDYSISYNDPESRFYIAAISDGHSDKNCFRSSVGSRLACEAVKEVLLRFCETYLEEEMHFDDLDDDDKERLKKSIKQCWDNKVEKDLKDNPIKEEELEELSDKVRAYYASGRGLENVYGATLLATAICKDLWIILHIGDGVILSISSEGKYLEPIVYDPKSESGEPSSICNNDLFLREYAFRCEFLREIPTAVFLTSDGIGDSLDDLSIREFLYNLLTKLEEKRENNNAECLNDLQQTYLDSCVSYYAGQGQGVEDDCSIGGIYMEDQEIPLVSVSLDYAMELLDKSVETHNAVVQDYERRKKDTIRDIQKLESLCESSYNEWLIAKNRIEDLRKILNNIVNNEEGKQKALEGRVRRCNIYVERAGGTADSFRLLPISPVDPKLLEEDKNFISFKNAKMEHKTKVVDDNIVEDLESAEEENEIGEQSDKITTDIITEAEDEELQERDEQDDEFRNLEIGEITELDGKASEECLRTSEKEKKTFRSGFQGFLDTVGIKRKND